MLETMTARQLIQWELFDAEHPIGDLRNEVEFAKLKYLIAALVDKNPSPIEDFMWSFKPAKRMPSQEELANKIMRGFGVKTSGD